MYFFAPLLEMAGRFLLGAMFVVGGLRHIPGFGPVSERMRARGVPLPKASLAVGTTFQIVAGSLLALGLFQQMMALGLIVFTLAASAIIHNFWDLEGDARRTALFWWQSNSGIIGGLLVLASFSRS